MRIENLAGDVLEFMRDCGFHLACCRPLQELSPRRWPVGRRAKGFTLFSSLLFVKKIEELVADRGDPRLMALKLYKLACIASIHGYVEYALDAIDAADRIGATEVPEILGQTAYFPFLCRLKNLAMEMPGTYPPQFSELYSAEEVRRQFDIAEEPAETEVKGILIRTGKWAVKFMHRARGWPRRKCAAWLRRFSCTDLEMHLYAFGLDGIADEVKRNRVLDCGRFR